MVAHAQPAPRFSYSPEGFPTKASRKAKIKNGDVVAGWGVQIAAPAEDRTTGARGLAAPERHRPHGDVREWSLPKPRTPSHLGE